MTREQLRKALVWVGFGFGVLGIYPLFCPWDNSQDRLCGLVLSVLVTAIAARLTVEVSQNGVDWPLCLLVGLFVASGLGALGLGLWS